MADIRSIFKDYNDSNPFSDSQARSYSDKKLVSEFYPTSNFWSLFNDQHEVLLGTRGSGKTFLLKMMRYSMLLRIDDPRAKKIIKEQNFMSLYVPMHLEFVTNFSRKNIDESDQIALFQFSFNCLLAISLINEIQSIFDYEYSNYDKAVKSFETAKYLNEIWFDSDDSLSYDLISLKAKVNKMYYSMDINNAEKYLNASMFKNQICAPLIAVKEFVSDLLGMDEEPTWIVCIDEAEFLNEPLQRCINNIFRSDSNGIALKVATLHYKHITLKTLDDNISVSAGNDFTYRVVDLDCESNDFINLSDSLCAQRLNSNLNIKERFTQLGDFVETIFTADEGNQKREYFINYYRNEFGDHEANKDMLKENIIRNLKPNSRVKARKNENWRKAYYDKYAPVYMVRAMFKQSKIGNTTPTWYCGASMVRRISQGNPRLYLELLNKLFETAKINNLGLKAQHKVLYKFSEHLVQSTQALAEHGPTMYSRLEKIADEMHDRVHGEYLRNAGSSFKIKYENDEEFEESKKWIELAIAYSRLSVEDEALINGLQPDTRYLLSNFYAAYYWLPMRYGDAPSISVNSKVKKTYQVKNNSQSNQISLFEGSEIIGN